MPPGLKCWKCGQPLSGFSRPYSRRSVCAECNTELHVCRFCTQYNPRTSDKCDEPLGEHPREADRANFCDYFDPDPDGFNKQAGSKSESAKSQVNALFAQARKPESEQGETKTKLDELFSLPKKEDDV